MWKGESIKRIASATQRQQPPASATPVSSIVQRSGSSLGGSTAFSRSTRGLDLLQSYVLRRVHPFLLVVLGVCLGPILSPASGSGFAFVHCVLGCRV